MSRKKILLVDDEEDFLSVLEKGLIAEGYSVITTPNGADAAELALAMSPDLIILDVLMPDVDGQQVNRMLKQNLATRDIPVIFLTGMFQKREASQHWRLVGRHVLFEKPYDILELIAMIEELTTPACDTQGIRPENS